MRRRTFLKAIAFPLVFPRAWLSAGEVRDLETRGLRLWSYYVPLTSYEGILDTIPDQHPWDCKVKFEEVIKKTNRISGKETDGTSNPASFELIDLDNADGFIRVRFWHDDNGTATSQAHSLFIFRRYLDDLLNGQKVFVATGMFQGHFHVVMIQPKP